MEKRIDLHIHSSFSEDADLSVNEIFETAQKASISAIAITDHDSIQSINAALSILPNYNFDYVPGIEITTVFSVDDSQQHILGYYVDGNNSGLLQNLNRISLFRDEIAHQRIEALKSTGFILDENNIKEIAGDRPVSAVSIIIELLNNKSNSDDERLYPYLHGNKKDNKVMSFYRDFLVEGKPAYVPFKSISTEEGINTIKKAGGIPILAHPCFVKNNNWLDNIKEMGIAGIEAVSSYHSDEQIKFYIDYAEKKGLLITAGSDFHGLTAKPHIKLGDQQGMCFSYYEKLKEKAGK
ncbi:MAG: PHP domain-containing protein [Spirochaetes bacterium]|nr:PHP domain-containing protein [Spirochaetota bacterium]